MPAELLTMMVSMRDVSRTAPEFTTRCSLTRQRALGVPPLRSRRSNTAHAAHSKATMRQRDAWD